MSGHSRIAAFLPQRVAAALAGTERARFLSFDEIRLRTSRPLAVTVGGATRFIDESGAFCPPERALCVTERDMNECVRLLTECSRWSVDDAIREGYIPFGDGMRAGVCGEALMRSGSVATISRITSINLRISRRVDFFASPLISYYASHGVCGTLVCAPPACGKTTFLRSVIYMLSAGSGTRRRRVGVADSRYELCADGMNRLSADFLPGCPKAYAIELLTRVMNPEVIVCDELSASEESAVCECANCGVPVIASVHAANKAEAARRPFVSRLVKSGMFPLFVCLTRDENGFYVTVGREESG